MLDPGLPPAQKGLSRGDAVPTLGEGRSRQARGARLPSVRQAGPLNPEEYDMDIPLGEPVVEATRETPRWRICFNPEEPQ